MLAHRAEALSPAASLVAEAIISRASTRPATGADNT
jgi:hypothetical protein